MLRNTLNGTSTTSSVYTAFPGESCAAVNAPRSERARTKARPRLNHQVRTSAVMMRTYGPTVRSPESSSGRRAPNTAASAVTARIAAGNSRSLEGESVAQVADVGAHSGQRLEAEAARDELEDRGRVVDRLVDMTFARERRDHHRRDARARPPAVAPARS